MRARQHRTALAVPLAFASVCALACAVVCPPLGHPLAPAPAACFAATATTPTAGSVVSSITPALDEATKKALELEDRIELAAQDTIALEQRISVVNVRILSQENDLDEALLELERARNRFDERIVDMYKAGLSSPISILLSARSVSDFYARAVMMARIVAEDVAIYREAQRASQEAEFVASVLDDMKKQLVVLRRTYDARLAESKKALDEQRKLITLLSEQGRQLVIARQAAAKRSRREWLESSIPVGVPIRFIPALLETTGQTYLVSYYQPLDYAVAGEPFTAVCSWYGNEFNGRPTASGQIFNEDDLTCASRTLAFGTRIALSRGDKRVIVVVTDRGPFIEGRDLDLSKAAARALGFSGVEMVDAVYVRPTSEASGVGGSADSTRDASP